MKLSKVNQLMKKKSVSYLKKKLDKVFSEWVRRKEESLGCFVCGVKKPWKQMHAGHYVSRTCQSLRWTESNVHICCPRCNVFLHGNMITYREKMVAFYGLPIVEMLEAERHKTSKIYPSELEVLIAHYTDEIKKLVI